MVVKGGPIVAERLELEVPSNSWVVEEEVVEEGTAALLSRPNTLTECGIAETTDVVLAVLAVLPVVRDDELISLL